MDGLRHTAWTSWWRPQERDLQPSLATGSGNVGSLLCLIYYLHGTSMHFSDDLSIYSVYYSINQTDSTLPWTVLLGLIITDPHMFTSDCCFHHYCTQLMKMYTANIHALAFLTEIYHRVPLRNRQFAPYTCWEPHGLLCSSEQYPHQQPHMFTYIGCS